jgi:hypothetical protein
MEDAGYDASTMFKIAKGGYQKNVMIDLKVIQ